MSDKLPFVIAGGGIATALGLAQKGVLCSSAPALGEIGAGIRPGPNAFHSFDQLGSVLMGYGRTYASKSSVTDRHAFPAIPPIAR
jgi:hypothetical protein